MNTPNDVQLQLFNTPEPFLESSFYEWEIDLCNMEKSIELSDEDFKLFLGNLVWQDAVSRLKSSQQQDSAQVTEESGLLLSGYQLGTQAMPICVAVRRSVAGGIPVKVIVEGEQTVEPFRVSRTASFAIALTMGFPSSWFAVLSQKNSNKTTTPSLVKPQAERTAHAPLATSPTVSSSEQGISQDERLHFTHKQPSPSAESFTSQKLLGGDEKLLEHRRGERSSPDQDISIPCLVKQPKQPEVKGVIKKDEGNRFIVEANGEKISVSKLFVYPDFSKSVGQIPPTKNVTPPSKSSPTICEAVSPSKTRRKKGDGTGYIYRRTITRRGKQYQEAYFRYRNDSGKLKAKYIPQRLLYRVEEAESAKKPIADILFLLGGDRISRGEHSSICEARTGVRRLARSEANRSSDSFRASDNVPLQTSQTQNKSDEPISIDRGEQPTPPSTKRRKQGEGTGYIECKPIKRSGKEYKQYWYHYEEWREGDCTSKKSRYIPKRLVARVEKMEAEKVSVREILAVLISKGKRSQK